MPWPVGAILWPATPVAQPKKYFEEFYLKAVAAQHGRDLGGAAEIGAVGADHRKILRAAKQDALDERQNQLEMKQVQRPQPPSLRVRRLDHGEDAAGFQDARDQGGEPRMLVGIERLQARTWK